MRTIITPPGIGDFLWLAMKLLGTGEQFKVAMSDGIPQRGHQLQELLPELIVKHEYRPDLKYKTINDNNAASGKRKWTQLTANEFYLSANRHLEEGRRIEQFLPDLPTRFKIEYDISYSNKLRAMELLKGEGKFIGIYTSAYSNARNWNGWGADKWYELIKALSTDKKFTFVLIGAEYDTGVTDDLIKAMNDSGVKFINTIGEPLRVVVGILQKLNYFIGFPSGLSILNETLGKDGTMFYPKHLAPMINSWAEPARIKEGNYKGCLFCEPKQIADWLINDYEIFERI